MSSMTLARPVTHLPRLAPLAAPKGWSAALLEAEYPLTGQARRHYVDAVADLFTYIPILAAAAPEEILLQFDRCRPAVEIPQLQENGRAWLPEFGMGVWFDRDLPTLWTEDEFLSARPGELRPFMYRMVRIQPQAQAQASAWRTLLGSGVLVRAILGEPNALLRPATEILRPMMTERSMTSFPFYVPLLSGALDKPHPAYAPEFAEIFAHTDAYLRESAEDGGLILLVRQAPDSLWKTLASSHNIELAPPARNLPATL